MTYDLVKLKHCKVIIIWANVARIPKYVLPSKNSGTNSRHAQYQMFSQKLVLMFIKNMYTYHIHIYQMF